jgi:hypothetical protein
LPSSLVLSPSYSPQVLPPFPHSITLPLLVIIAGVYLALHYLLQEY